jgi:hypothetical protein
MQKLFCIRTNGSVSDDGGKRKGARTELKMAISVQNSGINFNVKVLTKGIRRLVNGPLD